MALQSLPYKRLGLDREDLIGMHFHGGIHPTPVIGNSV